MNVDRHPLQPLAHFRGQDLHVAGEHHGLDSEFIDPPGQCRLRPWLGLRRDRNMLERNSVGGSQSCAVGVIGDDERDFDGEFPTPLPVKQVEQAVLFSPHHDQHLGQGVAQTEGYVCAELIAHRTESANQIPLRLSAIEDSPHSERVGRGITKLGALNDIGPGIEQDSGDPVDYAGSVDAFERESETGQRSRLPPAVTTKAPT